jgi:hypothetical protein
MQIRYNKLTVHSPSEIQLKQAEHKEPVKVIHLPSNLCISLRKKTQARWPESHSKNHTTDSRQANTLTTFDKNMHAILRAVVGNPQNNFVTTVTGEIRKLSENCDDTDAIRRLKIKYWRMHQNCYDRFCILLRLDEARLYRLLEVQFRISSPCTWSSSDPDYRPILL